MTGVEFPRVVWEFLAATNSVDRAWMETLFADDCSVDACGFRARGRAAVTSWTSVELLDAGITLAMLDVRTDTDVTVIHADALDQSLAHECFLAFRTSGRHIRSLTVLTAHDPGPVTATNASRTTEARRIVTRTG